MSAQILAVVVDCRGPRRQAAFWAAVLSHEMTERNLDEFKSVIVADKETPSTSCGCPNQRSSRTGCIFDLVTDGPMELEVARLTDLGASVIDVRHDPQALENPDTWTVMQDPEGNEFCVPSWMTVTDWS